MQLSCTVPDNDDTPIRRWKRLHQLTYPQAAALLGLKTDYARKLGCGSVRPSPKLARQIEERSGGEIKATDLVFGEFDDDQTEAAS